MTFLGQIMREDGIENLAIAGRIAGSRSRGRPREEIIGGRITTQQFLTATRDHEQWRSISGYVCNGSPYRYGKVEQ